MMTDLRIVGCASFHKLDIWIISIIRLDIITEFPYMNSGFYITQSSEFTIIVSKDTKSMLSPEAIKAYKTVCSEFGLRTPEFISYATFREGITHD